MQMSLFLYEIEMHVILIYWNIDIISAFTLKCSYLYLKNELPRDKTNQMTVRPAKTHISLGIRPVWSELVVRSMGS